MASIIRFSNSKDGSNVGSALKAYDHDFSRPGECRGVGRRREKSVVSTAD